MDDSARRIRRDRVEQDLRRIFNGTFYDQQSGTGSIFDLRGAAHVNITIVNKFDNKTGE